MGLLSFHALSCGASQLLGGISDVSTHLLRRINIMHLKTWEQGS